MSTFTPSTTPIRNLTDEEKPREKAILHGMDTLSDVELLALLLGSGVPGKSVLDLSREILQDCDNNLRLLSRMTVAELKKKYKGVGTAKATLLVGAMTFGGRVQASMGVTDPQMACSQDVFKYMKDKLERLNHEEFWILHLNRANRVMHRECISRGGVASTAVDPKIVAKNAIDHLSSGLILVHNHPSGNTLPSPQDDALTRRIVDICKVIDIPVHDHVIVTAASFYSYRDHSRL